MLKGTDKANLDNIILTKFIGSPLLGYIDLKKREFLSIDIGTWHRNIYLYTYQKFYQWSLAEESS